jgi:hypothetical protein
MCYAKSSLSGDPSEDTSIPCLLCVLWTQQNVRLQDEILLTWGCFLHGIIN